MRVLGIKFNVKFKGSGIVNFNGTGPKQQGMDTKKAKKVGDKPFVSRNCILSEALASPNGFDEMLRYFDQSSRYQVYLHPTKVLRGYVDTDHNLGRRSAISFTNALPTENCKTIIEEAVGKDGAPVLVDYCPEVEVESEVFINLSDLMLLTSDLALFTQPNLNLSDKKFLSSAQEHFEKYFGEKLKVGMYQKGKGSLISIEGVLLSKKTTLSLLKTFFDNLTNFNLLRASSYLKFDSISNVQLITSDEGTINDLKSFQGILNELSSDDVELGDVIEISKFGKDINFLEAHIKGLEEKLEEIQKAPAKKKSKGKDKSEESESDSKATEESSDAAKYKKLIKNSKDKLAKMKENV